MGACGHFCTIGTRILSSGGYVTLHRHPALVQVADKAPCQHGGQIWPTCWQGALFATTSHMLCLPALAQPRGSVPASMAAILMDAAHMPLAALHRAGC